MRLKITQPPTPLSLGFSTLDDTYKIDIKNKFQTLLECDFEEILPDEMWELGKEQLVQVAKKTIKKVKRIKNNWISEETRAEIEKRRNLKGRKATDQYRQQNSSVQRLLRRDKNLHINRNCKTIEENSVKHSTKEFYRGIRNLTKKFRQTNETIKDKNGNTLCNGESIKERWKQYSEDLHKTNENITQNNIKLTRYDEEPPLCGVKSIKQ